MKIVDTRDNTVLTGELVATLPARVEVDEDDMLQFYGMRPSDKNFGVMQKAMPYERLVLRRGDGDKVHSEPSFFIVPRYPFYEVRIEA